LSPSFCQWWALPTPSTAAPIGPSQEVFDTCTHSQTRHPLSPALVTFSSILFLFSPLAPDLLSKGQWSDDGFCLSEILTETHHSTLYLCEAGFQEPEK
jgi:hypothetical protein